MPFYRQSFQQCGAEPGDICSMEDLQKLPFTYKDDLRDNFPCGRTHARREKVSGRTGDMIMISGGDVFPSQVESILLEMGETEPHYQLVIDRVGSLDTLQVSVEVSEQMLSDHIRGLETLERKLRFEIDNLLGVSVDVKLVEPKSILRSEGKAQRVIDKRSL